MNIIKVKTVELIGPALDWAVAKAEGVVYDPHYISVTDFEMYTGRVKGTRTLANYNPSADWRQGGPLIEQHGVAFLHNSWPGTDEIWTAVDHNGGAAAQGKTHLIAACRAIVAAKLGDEVEVPAELVAA